MKVGLKKKKKRWEGCLLEVISHNQAVAVVTGGISLPLCLITVCLSAPRGLKKNLNTTTAPKPSELAPQLYLEVIKWTRCTLTGISETKNDSFLCSLLFAFLSALDPVCHFY